MPTLEARGNGGKLQDNQACSSTETGIFYFAATGGNRNVSVK
jgi:hypothetical protein